MDNKNIRKDEELSQDALEKVTGGTGNNFDMEHMQEYLNEIMSQNNTSIEDATTNPHNKGEKGKLIKK